MGTEWPGAHQASSQWDSGKWAAGIDEWANGKAEIDKALSCNGHLGFVHCSPPLMWAVLFLRGQALLPRLGHWWRASGRQSVFLNLSPLLHNCSCSIHRCCFFNRHFWQDLADSFVLCLEVALSLVRFFFVFFLYLQAGRGYYRTHFNLAIHHS